MAEVAVKTEKKMRLVENEAHKTTQTGMKISGSLIRFAGI
jgi:hypothetical protein